MWPAGISEGGQDVGVVQLTADQGLQSWGHLGGQGGVRDLHPTSTITDSVKMTSSFRARGHFWYGGAISGIMGPFLVSMGAFLVSWGHSGIYGAISGIMGQDYDLHATIGTAIGIVAAVCNQGGSSIGGGITPGVEAGSLISMQPLRAHKNERVSTNLRRNGRSVCDLHLT